MVKNPNKLEAYQLAIYKHGWGHELKTTEDKSSQQLAGFSIEAGIWQLITAYFNTCCLLLCILLAASPSLVYSPSVCHSCVLKVGQTPTSNPIENPELEWGSNLEAFGSQVQHFLLGININLPNTDSISWISFLGAGLTVELSSQWRCTNRYHGLGT